MKKFYWFTQTGIACESNKELSFDFTPFIIKFLESKLWERVHFRSEYAMKFKQEDLEKVKSIKLHIHTDIAPLSNEHEYEAVIKKFVPLDSISKVNLYSSGLRQVDKLAIIVVDYESNMSTSPDLTYEQEKDVNTVLTSLTHERFEEIAEIEKIQSIVCDFVQFFVFNLHLNYLTIDYSFHWKNKPNPMGLVVLWKDGVFGSRIEKVDILSHYILYDKEMDNLAQLMDRTAEFWCVNAAPIHYFLEALKGDHISYANFILLLFTLESFFEDRISNDYISLVVPLAVANNQSEMELVRSILRRCFDVRNKIVHGKSLFNIHDNKYKTSDKADEMNNGQLFIELKNIIIKLFYFCLRSGLFLGGRNKKISHSVVFKCIPHGFGK